MTPRIILISGPTAGGKTSLVDEVKNSHSEVGMISILTTTTRDKRRGESTSAYNFVSAIEFKDMIDKGRFVEFDQVQANFYGVEKRNLLAAAEKSKESGCPVVCIMTPPGVFKCKDFLEDKGIDVHTVFIEVEKNVSIVRTVSRYMAERRNLLEAGGTKEDEKGLADVYADRMVHIRNVEPQWRHYNWDARIFNGEGKDKAISVEELSAIVLSPEKTQPESKLAIQQAASSLVR